MKYRQYPSDPVLIRAGFRCEYCGRDLLADLDTFLTLCRDHLVPRSAGGPDCQANRVASCSCCDRLKADAVVGDLTEARREIAAQRASRAVWLDRIRDMVRSEPAKMYAGSPITRAENPGLRTKCPETCHGENAPDSDNDDSAADSTVAVDVATNAVDGRGLVSGAIEPAEDGEPAGCRVTGGETPGSSGTVAMGLGRNESNVGQTMDPEEEGKPESLQSTTD